MARLASESSETDPFFATREEAEDLCKRSPPEFVARLLVCFPIVRLAPQSELARLRANTPHTMLVLYEKLCRSCNMTPFPPSFSLREALSTSGKKRNNGEDTSSQRGGSQSDSDRSVDSTRERKRQKQQKQHSSPYIVPSSPQQTQKRIPIVVALSPSRGVPPTTVEGPMGTTTIGGSEKSPMERLASHLHRVRTHNEAKRRDEGRETKQETIDAVNRVLHGSLDDDSSE